MRSSKIAGVFLTVWFFIRDVFSFALRVHSVPDQVSILLIQSNIFLLIFFGLVRNQECFQARDRKENVDQAHDNHRLLDFLAAWAILKFRF